MDPKKITALLNEYIVQKELMSDRHIEHIKELHITDPHEAKLHAAKYRIIMNTVNDDFLNKAAEKIGVDLSAEHTGQNQSKTSVREILIINLLPFLDQTILNNFDKNFNDLFK